MVKLIKFYFCLKLILFSFQSFAFQDFNILKAEVTGRSVILDNNIEKARRLALEDALYLSSLKGGAFVDDFQVYQKYNCKWSPIIKSDSKILDFKILSEKNKDHYEIKLLAIIGKNTRLNVKKNQSIFLYLNNLSSFIVFCNKVNV